MNEFKAGDKVKCLSKDGPYSPYIPGEIYTVTRNESGGLIRITGPGIDTDWGAYKQHFEPLPFANTAEDAVKKLTAKLKQVQAELDVAEKAAAEAAKKFTQEDLKPGLVVGFFGAYRVLVAIGEGWSLVSPTNWRQQNSRGNDADMLECLNTTSYTKTNKSLKDIL